MRLGIFGGTFDPVHYGHLLLAETCREAQRLDRIWFLPAAIPPHKRQRELTDSRHRLEMLRLAIAGHEAFDISLLELERSGVSYTVDTLRTIHQQRADAELFLLMGADTLADLPHWREPQAILELALPLVVDRGQRNIDWNPLKDLAGQQRWIEMQNQVVAMPLVEFSSSAIRNDVARGRSIRYRTPRAVERYIATHQLYQQAE
jgi:nicotinate-nucleotide adenylyltransferase